MIRKVIDPSASASKEFSELSVSFALVPALGLRRRDEYSVANCS